MYETGPFSLRMDGLMRKAGVLLKHRNQVAVIVSQSLYLRC